MTAAQQTAFSQIEQIAREHFSAAVFICNTEPVDMSQAESDTHDDVRCTYHGGYATSIGLTQIAQLKVFRKEIDPTAP